MNIVVLTGAGISQESEINTFRDETNGLWKKHKIEEIATIDGFYKDPLKCLKFYEERKKEFKDKKPNKAHLILAEIEKKYKDNFYIITQNIDDLHEKAGNKNIIHIHGNIYELKCLHCKKSFIYKEEIDFSKKIKCHNCFCNNNPIFKNNDKTLVIPNFKHNVILFGEVPLSLDKTYQLLQDCDLFISIGTSGNVYPANDFVNIVKNNRRKAKTVELNLEPSLNYFEFDEYYHGKATHIVPEFFKVKNLLNL